MKEKPAKKYITDTRVILAIGVASVLVIIAHPDVEVEKFTCDGVVEAELVEYLPQTVGDPRGGISHMIGFVAEKPDGGKINVMVSQGLLPALGDKMLFDICTDDGDDKQRKWYRRKRLTKTERPLK